MKKKEIVLIILILLIAGVLYLFLHKNTDTSAHTLRITVDGEVYGEYAMEQDQIIKINDTNVCTIKGGTAYMSKADCPDQICVKTKAIESTDRTIVCLPNKVILEVIADDDSSETPDAVAS